MRSLARVRVARAVDESRSRNPIVGCYLERKHRVCSVGARPNRNLPRPSESTHPSCVNLRDLSRTPSGFSPLGQAHSWGAGRNIGSG